MAGTGIHGYTGTSSDGKYNIVNGQIVSQNPSYSTPATTSGGYAIANRNGTVMDTATANGLNASEIAMNLGNQIANAVSQVNKGDSIEYAKQISNIVSQSNSDYGDMIREILANQDANTAKSQAFAREQMDYQTRSDQAAMAWSAQEAQKNRDWQERLSDQAHQREVKDLMAAGLNPILSANQGAYTGSGATGQGFSSSGAMGSVDTSANSAMAGLLSTAISSAMQAEVAKIYTDAERYSSDLQYSSSRLATEASILNNQNTNNATRQNVLSQINADLERTRIQGEYGLANTNLSNTGAMQRTQYSEGMSNFRSLNSEAQQNYRTEQTNQSNEKQNAYKVDYGSFMSGGPWHKIADDASTMLGLYTDKIKKFLGKSHGRASSYDSPSSMLKYVGWG